MNGITKELLGLVSDLQDVPEGAYNIREDGACAGRQNSKHITIIPKMDKPGIDIHIDSLTRGEKVYIPACVTHSNVEDLVYNDFYVAAGADAVIVAGCGVNTDGEEESKHNGVHRFFLEKGAHVVYLEKHIGIGNGTGQRIINPQTWVELAEGAYMEMNTTQIKGVDSTSRLTNAKLEKDARLVIREKIMTHGMQFAESSFEVELNGEGSGADLVSHSVARDHSQQTFRSRIIGNTVCTGHSECDSIVMDHGVVHAIPELTANSVDASLIHEAAIGKIAGEQLIKLMTLGLTEKEAESKIIDGFLK